MKITNCQVDHLTAPMGFAMGCPRFTYLVEEASGTRQTAVRIVIAREGETVYDTGWRETADLTGVQTDFTPAPCTGYQWQVCVRTDAEEGSSSWNTFETGKMGTPWKGVWLTHPRAERMPVFRRRIPVRQGLKSARLYVCGLGLYEAFLTPTETTDSRELTLERKIGEEYLTPDCNNYNSWLQYQTYDITQQLAGSPVLNIWLGQGWYLGRFGFIDGTDEQTFYGKEFRIIADIRLTYADGTEETIGTDGSWQVWPSNICHNNIYDGETLDDTLPQGEAYPATVYTGAMAPLTDRWSLPVKAMERKAPIALLTTPAGEQVFDLGQNLSGVFRLRVRPEKGDHIHVQVGEVLQEGNFYNDNLRSAKAEYHYTSDGRETTLQPKFTYYGCRYIKVSGVRDLKLEDLEALVFYSDMAELGTLSTGHEKLNRLIANAHWGLKGNFLDVPTDCPQRDERMGWTGDAQVFSATACFFRDTFAFYRKYLHDMHTEQQDLGGKVPIVVPSFGYTDTACVWGDAATIMPWNLYQFTGDKSILALQYDSMKSWVDYLHGFDGDDRKWGQAFHYGDWLALDHPSHKPDSVMGGTDEDYIAYVYLSHSAGLVAKAAEILGKPEDAAHYTAMKQALDDFLRREYFSPNGRCCINTQTGSILALYFGLTPNQETAEKQLLRSFQKNDCKLQTGFVGTPLMCNVLTEHGMERLAWDLVLYEDYPGWLYTVNLGATTSWERWNSMDPDGSVSSTGMNSFNHYSYGSIAEWMFRHMAGLQQLTPGFQHCRIAPVYDRRIGRCDMTYRSAAGTWEVHWKTLSKYRAWVSVTVPFGCQAELSLYGSGQEVQTLTAGTYTFEYDSTLPLGNSYSADSTHAALFRDPRAAAILAPYGITADRIPGQYLQKSLRTLAKSVETRFPAQLVEEIDRKLREL